MVQIPGDTIEGHPRSRSVRLERTRPRSIMVNRAGRRFVNEAAEYNSMAGAFHYLDPRGGYVNDPGWIVFDTEHLRRYGFLGVAPGDPVPGWFNQSPDLAALAARIGVDADGLTATVTGWNADVAAGHDPAFGDQGRLGAEHQGLHPLVVGGQAVNGLVATGGLGFQAGFLCRLDSRE